MLLSAAVFGWVGSALLLVCSSPQAYQSWKQGHSRGLSPYMLWMWISGMLIQGVYFAAIGAWPAVISHSFNIVVASTITSYYYFPRVLNGLATK